MGLAGGLHFGANRILKVSLCLGDTDGSILRMLCGSSRPAVGQFQPRSDGDSVYRAAVVAVRRDELFGHGGVRLGQRAAAAAGPDVGTRHSEPRYLLAGLPEARCCGIRGSLRTLHGGLWRGGKAQGSQGGRGTRRQSELVTRIYLLSKRFPADKLLTIVRSHWSIENALHWTLGVTLAEDLARNRKDHGPSNLAVLRRLALNIARAHPDTKTSLRRKLLRAGWDETSSSTSSAICDSPAYRGAASAPSKYRRARPCALTTDAYPCLLPRPCRRPRTPRCNFTATQPA